MIYQMKIRGLVRACQHKIPVWAKWLGFPGFQAISGRIPPTGAYGSSLTRRLRKETTLP
jgi:hypothetical protein